MAFLNGDMYKKLLCNYSHQKIQKYIYNLYQFISSRPVTAIFKSFLLTDIYSASCHIAFLNC